MTRRDYIAIAQAVCKARQAGLEGQALAALIMELCKVMLADNQRFDVNRFDRACRGVQS